MVGWFLIPTSFFNLVIELLFQRNNFDGVARRGGRGGGGGMGPSPGLGRGRGGGQMGMGPEQDNRQLTPQQQQQQQQRNVRGGPALLPEFSPTMMDSPGSLNTPGRGMNMNVTNVGPPTGTSANPLTSKLPGVLTDAPGSLMQKFSDFTHTIGGGGGTGGEASEGSILSKGKDLIFKRFGL